MVDPKKIILKKTIENEIDPETLERMNRNAGLFESHVRLVSGSEYRGLGILTSNDTVQVTAVLNHFADLKDNGLFDTKYDPKKLFSEYVRNGNILTKEHEELIKDYQKHINKYLKENGLAITIQTSNQEKKFVSDVAKNLGWKKGKEINKTVLDEREGRTHRKYEINIEKNGLGSILFYEKNENGEYEKVKKVLFDFNENRFQTELYQILVDGKMGIETFRAILYQYEKIQEDIVSMSVQEPVQEIMIGYSINGHYKRKVEGQNREKNITYSSPLKRRLGEELDKMNKPMTSISYDSQRSMMFGEEKEYTNVQQMLREVTRGDGVNKSAWNRFLNIFNEDIKEKGRGFEVDFFVFDKENVNMNSGNFNINFDEINNDFEMIKKTIKENTDEEYHERFIKFVDERRDSIIDRLNEIKSESRNLEDFVNRANNDRELIAKYDSSLIYVSHLPDEINMFNRSVLILNSKTEEVIKRTGFEKEEFPMIKDRNGNEFIKVDELRRGRNPEMYNLFMYHYFEVYVNALEEQLKKDMEIMNYGVTREVSDKRYLPNVPEIRTEDPSKYLEETEIERKKIDPDSLNLGEIQATKSPTEKEMRIFIEQVASSSAFTRYYQQKTGLVVDGDCGTITRNHLYHNLEGEDLWRDIQNPERRKEILENVGQILIENKNTRLGKREYKDFKKYVTEVQDLMGTGKKYDLTTDAGVLEAWESFGGSYLYRRSVPSEKEIKETINRINTDRDFARRYQQHYNLIRKDNQLVVDGISGPQTKGTFEDNNGYTLDIITFTMQMQDIQRDILNERNKIRAIDPDSTKKLEKHIK